MLAFIALFFPAAILVVWKRRLFKEDYDWKAMLIEYIAGVVLINFLVIAIAYLFFGSKGSVVSNINTYNGFALKYLILAIAISLIIPVFNHHTMPGIILYWRRLLSKKNISSNASHTVNDSSEGSFYQPDEATEQSEKSCWIKNKWTLVRNCRTVVCLKGHFSKTFVLYFAIAAGVLFLVFAVYCENYTERSSDMISSDANLGRMTSENIYSQDFICEYNGLESVKLSFATYGGTNSGSISVTLTSDSKTIDEWDIDCSMLADNTYYTFFLSDTQTDSAGKSYTISISPIGADEENGITAYINTSGDYSGLSINGEAKEGQTICYQLIYTNAAPHNGASPYIKRFLIFILVIFLVWAILQLCKLRIENVFLVFWLLLSGLFICSNTLFNVPDETGHFYRSFEISEGKLVSIYNDEAHAGGNYLPFDGISLSSLNSSWQEYYENKDELVLSEEDVFVGYSNQALMSPVNYLPQAIGMFVAKLFTDNISMIAYAGRFVNWLFATILFYFAIKILPKGKEFVCIVAMLPMSIHEAVSLASDTTVVALSVMMIAVVMYLRYEQKKPLGKAQIFLLYTLALLISLYKIVYVIFCMLYLLVPKERFKNGRKGKILHASIMIVLVAGLNLGWVSAASSFLVRRGTNSELQILYVLQYPIRYLLAIVRTFMSKGMTLIQQMMGTSLASLNVATVGLITMLCALQLIHIVGRDRNTVAIQKKQINERLCLTAIIGLLTVLTATSLYIQWTYVYTNSISGLQGRYFASMLLPVYLIAVGETYPINNITEERFTLFSQFVILISNIGACMSLLFAKIVI